MFVYCVVFGFECCDYVMYDDEDFFDVFVYCLCVCGDLICVLLY